MTQNLEISIDSLREADFNPRKHFAGLDDLIASVKQHGILVPLMVREFAKKLSGEPTYQILAGGRRYRAAKAVGLKTVPARLVVADDAAALELSIVDNLQREDVHPLDEALGYQNLIAQSKLEVAAIAKRVGKSASYVYQRLKLAALTPVAQKAFYEGKLTASHAILLARLQPADQTKMLAHCGHWSVRDLAREIEWRCAIKISKAPWDLKDAALVPASGACTTCPKLDNESCHDRGCFTGKLNAFVVRIETALKEKQPGAQFVRITCDGNWRAGEKGCKSSATGIISDLGGWAQDKERKPGELVKLCRDVKCKSHGNYGLAHHDYGKAERAKDKKNRALNEARLAAVTAIAAKSRWPSSSPELLGAALAFWRRLTQDARKLACRSWGLAPTGKMGDFDWEKEGAKHIAAQRATLAGVVDTMALIPEYGSWDSAYFSAKRELGELAAAAKRAGVPLAKLERDALAALKAKKPAKARVRK